ncbi:hypothetical protein [Methanobrevibacter sp. DSM 116169]|uniref:hypothetical protein n=1 Tax=Methanobrevibacter sp. DSM 116169 TaxID=3242727 RepID=UPI0038FC305A
MDFYIIMGIRLLIIFLIVYAVIKNLKLLLFIGLILLALLFLQDYYGLDLAQLANQVIYSTK